MNYPPRDRTVLIESDAKLGGGRSDRLMSLADRLERTLAHQLMELGPMAWAGDAADTARDRLRACSIELAVAAAGLRRTADRIGGST